MPIVATAITTEPPQIDGRFWAHETQTYDTGEVDSFDYLADAGTDVNAIAAARASELSAEEAAAAVYVPSQVSAIQARQAILQMGYKAQVEAAVAGADPTIQAQWYGASVLDRDNAEVIAVATAAGIADQLDALFRLAGKL